MHNNPVGIFILCYIFIVCFIQLCRIEPLFQLKQLVDIADLGFISAFIFSYPFKKNDNHKRCLGSARQKQVRFFRLYN